MSEGRTCPRCMGSGQEPLTARGSDPCMACERCFDEELGYSTGVVRGDDHGREDGTLPDGRAGHEEAFQVEV